MTSRSEEAEAMSVAGEARAACDRPDRPAVIPAFTGCGIELEYMIVDRDSLAIRPIAGSLLDVFGAHPATPAAQGLGWSNELVRHVVEVKNVTPTTDLDALARQFHDAVRAANRILAGENAQLMPTAMHPFMDPRTETVLWDHEIYRAYDRIYGCRAHGWANLQSVHINLPFAGDAEFARLHAAIRLILPLLPALAASSPVAEGAPTGMLDFRLDAYRKICAITPRVSGRVVPETITTRSEYQARILAPMYDEIAPHDPARLLRHEWLNSRGAIPRFDRSAIEIRVVDVQECPQADVAIAACTAAVAEAIFGERFAPLREQQSLDTGLLHGVLLATIRDADAALVEHPEYLRALGIPRSRCTARDIWRALIREVGDGADWWRGPIEKILHDGPLARRILRATDGAQDPRRLRGVYARLCRCLDDGRMLD